MLETKVPAVSTQPHRAARHTHSLSSPAAGAPPRAAVRAGRAQAAARVQAAARPQGRDAPARPQGRDAPAHGTHGAVPRSMRPATGPAGHRRLARSEARLLAIAIACTTILCGLLVLYLAAYAHVTLLGIDQSHKRVLLRARLQENQELKALYASLQSPHRIAAAAQKMGMVREAPRVDYIRLDPVPAAIPGGAADTETDPLRAEGRGQVSPGVKRRGTTADDNPTAASLDH